MKRVQQKNTKISNTGAMTKNRIASMRVLDSYKYLRLLQDRSEVYYVFNNYSLNSRYSTNYYEARKFFEQQANKLDS